MLSSEIKYCIKVIAFFYCSRIGIIQSISNMLHFKIFRTDNMLCYYIHLFLLQKNISTQIWKEIDIEGWYRMHNNVDNCLFVLKSIFKFKIVSAINKWIETAKECNVKLCDVYIFKFYFVSQYLCERFFDKMLKILSTKLEVKSKMKSKLLRL